MLSEKQPSCCYYLKRLPDFNHICINSWPAFINISQIQTGVLEISYSDDFIWAALPFWRYKIYFLVHFRFTNLWKASLDVSLFWNYLMHILFGCCDITINSNWPILNWGHGWDIFIVRHGLSIAYTGNHVSCFNQINASYYSRYFYEMGIVLAFYILSYHF